jgi:hypothetical protein
MYNHGKCVPSLDLDDVSIFRVRQVSLLLNLVPPTVFLLLTRIGS